MCFSRKPIEEEAAANRGLNRLSPGDQLHFQRNNCPGCSTRVWSDRQRSDWLKWLKYGKIWKKSGGDWGLGIFDCWLWKEEQSQTCNALGGSCSWVSQKKERKKKPLLKCEIVDAARSSVRSHGTEFIFKPKRGLAKHKRGIFFYLKVMRPLLNFHFHCAPLLLRSAFKKQPRLLLKQIFNFFLCPFHMYAAKWHGGQSLEAKMARKKNKVQKKKF